MDRTCEHRVAPNCRGTVTRHSKTGACVPCSHILQRKERTKTTAETPAPVAVPTVADDRKVQKLTAELQQARAKYKDALTTIERLEAQVEFSTALKGDVETFHIEPKQGSGTSEATLVALASDWHIEERVDKGTVSGLNEFNLEIAHQRVTKFFQGMLRLTRLLQQDVRIDNIVLALLGDFISNDIHDEVAELSDLQPMHAITTVQSMLISGIEFLLNHTTCSFIVPCHSGNHARTTKTTRFGSENGHSLEYLLYMHLAAYFRHEPRVSFIITPGMHSYVQVYDQTLRFHHGHAVKYGGGVGGLFIPAYKAIGQWSKARWADLDCFGHFHQTKDGGNFLCNGSLIGYNAFALSIKADYEEPRQTLFLIDKKRGRTATWPILVK